MKEKDYSFIIGARQTIVDGDILWMLSFYVNCLLKIDLKEHRLIGAYEIPNGNIGVEQGHVGILKMGDMIYIFPFHGKGIFSFDVQRTEFKEIGSLGKENGENGNYAVVAKFDKYIYFIEMWGKGIYRLNSEDGSIEPKYFGDDEWRVIHPQNSGDFLFDRSCQKEDKLYIPVFMRNIIVELDLRKFTYILHVLYEVPNIHLRGIDSSGKNFILSTTEDELIIWKPGSILEIHRLGILKGELKSYYKIIQKDDIKILFPEWEKKIILIKNKDYAAYECLPFHSIDNASRPEHACTQFMAVFEYNDMIAFQVVSNGQIYYIDIENKKIVEADIEIPEQIHGAVIGSALRNKLRNERGSINETSLYELRAFLSIWRDDH